MGCEYRPYLQRSKQPEHWGVIVLLAQIQAYPYNSAMDSRRTSSSFFDREKHVVFLQMMNQLLPSDYQGQEINRLTLAYFAISGLHILGALDQVSTLLFPDLHSSLVFPVGCPENFGKWKKLKFWSLIYAVLVRGIFVIRNAYTFGF